MIQILDSTLREGEQTPGVYFDTHIKLAIASLLDRIGVDYIEAGHPLVSKEIYSAVKQIANSNLKAKVCAHSRSIKKDVDTALECNVDFIGIFFCVSEGRLNEVFKKDLDTAINQITEIIKYAKKQKPDLMIRFTPEDTVRSEFANVIRASVAAVRAGADVISVADTTGYMIPGTERSMYDYITRLKRELSGQDANPMIAVHCHNDRGLALANALDGYRAGVDIIDATVLSLGERAGLVDLAQLTAVLSADFNERKWNLTVLSELYQLVSNHAGIAIPVNYPITGKNAFTHCAGVHTQAAIINPVHYESLNPELFGRERKIALSHMSGIASVRYALNQIGEKDIDDDLALKILEKVKSVGQRSKTIDLEELEHIVKWCREHKF